MKALRDIVGREFRKGQSVAVAERNGNTAMLRTGIVEEVHENEDKLTIRWTDRDNYRFGADKSKIFVRGQLVDRPRIVVIG